MSVRHRAQCADPPAEPKPRSGGADLRPVGGQGSPDSGAGVLYCPRPALGWRDGRWSGTVAAVLSGDPDGDIPGTRITIPDRHPGARQGRQRAERSGTTCNRLEPNGSPVRSPDSARRRARRRRHSAPTSVMSSAGTAQVRLPSSVSPAWLVGRLRKAPGDTVPRATAWIGASLALPTSVVRAADIEF